MTLAGRLRGSIWNNPAAGTVFVKVTIDYARAELKKHGIDPLSLWSYGELKEFCNLWLNSLRGFENDMALIALLTRFSQSERDHLSLKKHSSLRTCDWTVSQIH